MGIEDLYNEKKSNNEMISKKILTMGHGKNLRAKDLMLQTMGLVDIDYAHDAESNLKVVERDVKKIMTRYQYIEERKRILGINDHKKSKRKGKKVNGEIRFTTNR